MEGRPPYNASSQQSNIIIRSGHQNLNDLIRRHALEGCEGSCNIMNGVGRFRVVLKGLKSVARCWGRCQAVISNFRVRAPPPLSHSPSLRQFNRSSSSRSELQQGRAERACVKCATRIQNARSASRTCKPHPQCANRNQNARSAFRKIIQNVVI